MLGHTMKHIARLVGLATLTALAGCNTPGFTDPNLPMHAEVAHPITVEAQAAEMEIAVGPQSVALLRVDETRLRAFAGAYRTRGHGAMTVYVPSDTPNSMAAVQVMADVHRVLTNEGLHPDAVQSRPYHPTTSGDWSPIILSFTRYEASASPCGDWSESYTTRFNGNPSPNWGCATQNNLAAMISEPADLIRPRAMTPASAARRSTVLDNYRQGADTASQVSDDGNGVVSDIQ